MNIVSSSRDLYNDYREQMRKIADVKNALAVLQWDQETYLPIKGASFRGQQIATLSELSHQLFTEKKLGDILQELVSRHDLSTKENKNVEISLEDYNKQKKFTSKFVREMSEAVSRSFHAWIEARKKNHFSFFEKDLDALIHLKRKEADLLGFAEHPYDALLDEYEKGCTVSMLDNIFNEIKQPLKALLDKIMSAQQVDGSFLHQHFPKQQQWDFGMDIIKQLGFDFEAGRQDISEHPFTTSFNKNDVRITTRIDENDFSNMLWSSIHETGHGLYEQGLPESEYGLPLGEYTSLSIHESQSRLWENNIGRSLPFWQHNYPALQNVFHQQLKNISVEDFYKGINKVQPSLIRTEADELTYHFHVMIRYDIEKLLIAGNLAVNDIPEFWDAQYEKYLGVHVTDDKNGCLQDVHWSHGSFGYFPTYSLGSFYAAQFFNAAKKLEPKLLSYIKNGDAGFLLGWLRKNIHQYGKMFKSEELCLNACGGKLGIKNFIDYLLDKYIKIYNL